MGLDFVRSKTIKSLNLYVQDVRLSPVNLIFLTLSLLFVSIASGHAELKTLSPDQLKDFTKLPEERQELLTIAMETAVEMKGMPYLFGGNGPASGGFDCSGAVFYLLKKIGLTPPRTSSAQYLWVKDGGNLHLVPETALDTDDESFEHLRPGDLVFWTGTYVPSDDRKTKITHVAIFLGHEVSDSRPVMINATNGRSYRGKKGDGFGVFDFRVPRPTSRSRLVAYGTPPGLDKEPE